MGLFDFLKNEGPPLTKIDELNDDSKLKSNFKKFYFDCRKPALIKNGAANWSMMEKWTKDYLIQNAGDYMCSIISDSRPSVAEEQTTLKDYFANHPGKSTLTLDRYKPNDDKFFFKDIQIPNLFFNKNSISRFFFYHSIKDAGTLPHNHRDAFNILRDGEKHWVMFNADQQISPEGYQLMMKFFQKYPVGSHAKDWFRKELKTLTKKVDVVYECFQKSGDIVYVPEGYAHTVINKSDEVLGIVVETHRTS